MFLEIVTPEAILFSSEIDSLSVPGVNGEFQMLNNHAPIVSILKKGTVLIQANDQSDLNDLSDKLVVDAKDNKILTLQVESGTLEMKDNKVILLAD